MSGRSPVVKRVCAGYQSYLFPMFHKLSHELFHSRTGSFYFSFFVDIVRPGGGGSNHFNFRGRAHARGCTARGSHASSGGQTDASSRLKCIGVDKLAEERKEGESLLKKRQERTK